jgi:hypothetical protein
MNNAVCIPFHRRQQYGRGGCLPFHHQQEGCYKMFLNVGMPDCLASGLSGTVVKKIPMPEQVQYHNKGTQFGT